MQDTEREKKTIGILRGGMEEGYDASLREGGEIISHIFENLSDKWKVVDIFIDKAGVWHMGGVEVLPASVSHRVDLVWNTAHHNHLNTLDDLSIPSIGNSSFSSLLRDNHQVLEKHIENLDLKMPKRIVLPVYQEDFDDNNIQRYATKKAMEVFEKFSSPWTVKSFTPDAGMGIHIAKTFPELIRAIEDGVRHQKSILIEEFIHGKNINMHSVGGFRGENVYVFPPKILYEKKVPTSRGVGIPTENVGKKIVQITKDLREHLGAEHYLKSDFVLHPKRGVFVTDISFSPDLKKDSHFHQTCEFVGAKAHHIIEHIIDRVLEKNNH